MPREQSSPDFGVCCEYYFVTPYSHLAGKRGFGVLVLFLPYNDRILRRGI